MASSSPLTDDQNERIREAVRTLVKNQYDDNVLSAAHAMRISQSTLHRFLTGQIGTSPQKAAIFARELGVPVSTLLEASADGDNRRAASALARAAHIITLEEVPGFRDALVTAMVEAPQYSPRVWARVARLHLNPPPERVSALMLIKGAEMVAVTYADKLSSGSDSPPPSRAGNRKAKSVSRLRRR